MQYGFDPLVIEFGDELMEILARVHGRAKAPSVPLDAAKASAARANSRQTEHAVSALRARC
jgi:hypothetical protein